MLLSQPHRRYNPLKGEWVLVSPQRIQRPWHGKKETTQKEKKPTYDPNCYLCPGNFRANGKRNLYYKNTYVFPNDFPALINTAGTKIRDRSDLFRTETTEGICRVVCFSPKHNLTLADMSAAQIEKVIQTWISQVNELRNYQWIQVFENKGSLMGCSNPHPHGQIWASNFVPSEIQKEDNQQKQYFKVYRSPLLSDYAQEELRKRERVVFENNSWLVVVPFWATWPFETLLLPKNRHYTLITLASNEKKDLAQTLKKILCAYDRLFSTSMPYSMGWHFAPLNKQCHDYWQLHAHYYPPLLRSATVKKFISGYEMLAEPQRDITPEQAADRLKRLI